MICWNVMIDAIFDPLASSWVSVMCVCLGSFRVSTFASVARPLSSLNFCLRSSIVELCCSSWQYVCLLSFLSSYLCLEFERKVLLPSYTPDRPHVLSCEQIILCSTFLTRPEKLIHDLCRRTCTGALWDLAALLDPQTHP